jgi:hypothetical protein
VRKGSPTDLGNQHSSITQLHADELMQREIAIHQCEAEIKWLRLRLAKAQSEINWLQATYCAPESKVISTSLDTPCLSPVASFTKRVALPLTQSWDVQEQIAEDDAHLPLQRF